MINPQPNLPPPGQPLMIRSNASAGSALRLPAAQIEAGGSMKRTCTECGTGFEAARHDAEFCSARCRQAFANRRQQRGAELYDLFMAHRFERKASATLKLLSLMNRLASSWRHEDHARRDSRRSWISVARLRNRLAHVMAVVVLRR